MITYEELIKYFSYDKDTGEFARIKTVRGSKLGAVGYIDSMGYSVIPFRRKRYSAHRLAWLYVTGKWPEKFIDHINGIKSDNRIENLREATNAENHQNLKNAMKSNKSGFLGVSKRSDRNKWVASIKLNGKPIHIGDYDSPEVAYEAYLAKKRELHTHCTI